MRVHAHPRTHLRFGLTRSEPRTKRLVKRSLVGATLAGAAIVYRRRRGHRHEEAPAGPGS